MNNFPKIETQRLILDKLKLEDVSLIAKYAGDRAVSKFTLNIPFPYEEKDAIWWVNNAQKCFEEKSQYTFGIYLKDTNEFIGGIGIILDKEKKSASLGYWVTVRFWNKGFTTEATKALIKFGFNELSLERIFAVHLVENKASGRVMQKAGMKYEETLDLQLKAGLVRRVKKYGLYKTNFKLG